MQCETRHRDSHPGFQRMKKKRSSRASLPAWSENTRPWARLRDASLLLMDSEYDPLSTRVGC
jgi:hypothetical protein